jgi:hypothetical protein
VSGTEKDQESLEPKKTRRVWNRKSEDQESLKPKKTRRVWNQKSENQESLKPKKTRKVCHRKSENQESLEPEEKIPEVSKTGRGNTRRVSLEGHFVFKNYGNWGPKFLK